MATADVPAKRAWPLDFAAVTDHSEYLGAVAQIDIADSAFSKSKLGRQLESGGRRAFFTAAAAIVEGENNDATPDLQAAAVAADGWNVEMRAANANYTPGVFTTFVAYEWTATPGHGVHMHRNVIFNSDTAPTPFSAVESSKPEDLWTFLDGVRKQGIDVLAIPHNSNFSDGRDFDWNMSDGKPIDAQYAAQRALNEPLVEIAQTKGQSETAPELSPTDEFADFEIMDHIYAGETKATRHGGYVREALGRGLVVESGVGANPFKLGFVGASDIHNGLSASDENAYAGGVSGLDPSTMLPSRRDRQSRTRHERSEQTRPAQRPTRERSAAIQLGGDHRRLGGGKHAQRDFRRAEAQGNFRHDRHAHSRAHVRRMDVPVQFARQARLGRDGLYDGRRHGRRSSAETKGERRRRPS